MHTAGFYGVVPAGSDLRSAPNIKMEEQVGGILEVVRRAGPGSGLLPGAQETERSEAHEGFARTGAVAKY
jgi:hypothetical protein